MITRRRFFAVLSALVAVPAFVRAKADEFESDALDRDELDAFDLACVPKPEPWIAECRDGDRFIRSAAVPAPTPRVEIPVHMGPGTYGHVVFRLEFIDVVQRTIRYQYDSGPRYWLTNPDEYSPAVLS